MSDSKVFLLSPKLSYHLEQLGLKKYGDDMKTKCFDNMAKTMQHISKVKAKFQIIQGKQKYSPHSVLSSIKLESWPI